MRRCAGRSIARVWRQQATTDGRKAYSGRMNTFPLSLHRQLQKLLPFDQLADQLLGVLVFATMLPLLTLIGFLLLAPSDWQTTTLIALVAVASLSALGIAAWLMRTLVAPVALSRLALYAYRREQRLLPMPLDLDGEVGSLINDLRATIETCERQRQIFAEQAEWAFRNKRSPLLDSRGVPRAVAGERIPGDRMASL